MAKARKITIHENLKVKCLSQYEPLEIGVSIEWELEEGDHLNQVYELGRDQVARMVEDAVRLELTRLVGPGADDRALGRRK